MPVDDPYAQVATMRSHSEMQLAGPYGGARLGTVRAVHSYRDCRNRMSVSSAGKQRALALGASRYARAVWLVVALNALLAAMPGMRWTTIMVVS